MKKHVRVGDYMFHFPVGQELVIGSLLHVARVGVLVCAMTAVGVDWAYALLIVVVGYVLFDISFDWGE